MDYHTATSYLLGTINETISRKLPYGLERMRALLDAMGNPHMQYPTIHVGGTSGKGSTSTMVAAVLQVSCKRIGLHTKPHLRSMTERARINGLAISEEAFAQTLEAMMPAIEKTTMEFGRPTYYETLLALAFSHFAREKVDIAVIEVGLGGRIDGTNVITPLVSAITSVGFDHMETLGETLREIAREKAGIAKPGVPLVVSIEDEVALATVREQAELAGAPLINALEATQIETVRSLRDGQAFSIRTSLATYPISTPALGEFQRRNAATTIAILEQLPSEFRPTAAAVEEGFATLTIPGRMEYYAGYPSMIFDIAHNAEKAEHLVTSLRESFPERRFSFVVAIGESKDALEILRRLATLPGGFTFTSFEVAGRTATKPQKLAVLAESLGTWGRVVRDPVEAISIARRNAAAEDVVVVTGSTFIVAELREWWLESIAAA
jgi:dihydrofolate synthase/folylpolyglutamate synthase